MRRLTILILLGAATLPVPPAVGQNLESFDIETIIDPLALRLEEGDPSTWLDFFGTYVQTGYAEDFQSGTRFTGTGVAFVDWLSTYIHNDLQFSGRVTGFERLVGDVTGPVRVELAAAHYFGVRDVKDIEAEADEPIRRLQVSVTRNQGDSAVERSTWSLEYDTMDPGESESPDLLNPPFDTIVRWRLAYGESDRFRLSSGSEPATVALPEEYQLSLEARTRTSPGWVGLAFDVGWGLGVRHSLGSTRLATGRLELRLEKRLLEDRFRIAGVYGPAYRFDSSSVGDRWNHEVTFYVHVPLVIKAF